MGCLPQLFKLLVENDYENVSISKSETFDFLTQNFFFFVWGNRKRKHNIYTPPLLHAHP